ncbi:ribosomal RNA processing protein 1 homolog B isoform X2 [Cajanus cajan]|uniref:ribosomal RNA processing protein 1 homolog B isoform X2 n=1 Tax=Cajanus cajan TaxID=3821 RepID=UPI0010FB74B9|nr:ribosomal RNA processing protein 1 homolog B isoform X2 [Cajanus cajan]
MEGGALIKQLACCNKATREKSLRLVLKSWLPLQAEPLPEDDAKKLWKGLFYCMWHSDKPLAQHDLVDRLSSLLLSLHRPLSLQYFSTFLLTMRREWSGIDALRLDKFYLLIRTFLAKFFSLLKTHSWDPHLLHLLDQGTFSSHDINTHGNGVNYHIATVFLEELRAFLPLNTQVLHLLFKPFLSAMGRVNDKVLLAKIKSGVFDLLLKMGRRLLELRKAGEEVDSRDDVLLLGTVALVMGFSGRLYEVASSAECVQGNRKVLFALHSEFLKLEKDVAKSGFDFAVPDVVDDEEVPDLVPLGPAEVDGNGELLKKCEKDVNGSVDGGSKSKKKKKKNKGDVSRDSNDKENVASENGANLNDEGAAVLLDETVIANLQRQFEKVAEEGGVNDGIASACESPSDTGNVSKKRKRTKSLKGKASQDSADLDGEESAVAMSGEKSAKKGGQ